jgi:hypothetical protein
MTGAVPLLSSVPGFLGSKEQGILETTNLPARGVRSGEIAEPFGD